MRLGCYTRAGLILLLFFFIASALANPVLLGRLLLPRVLGNIVAKRAATTELASLTSTSLTRMPALMEGSSVLSRLSPNLIRTGNALNWVGIGYSLNALKNDLFDGPKQYSMSTIEGTIYGSSPESLLTQSFETVTKNKKYRCYNEAGCEYSSLRDFSIKNIANPASVSVSAFFDKTDILTGVESKNLTYTEVAYLQSGSTETDLSNLTDEQVKQLESNKVDSQTIADILNNLLMKASLQEDYQGIPFNSSTKITASEVSEALNGQSATVKDLLEPTTHPANGSSTIIVLPSEVTNEINHTTGVDTSHPDNSLPEITPPAAKDIILPLNTFFPYLNELNFTSRVVTCPVIYMPVFDKTYRIASHCELLEQIRNILKLCSLIIWSFISLRIVLSS